MIKMTMLLFNLPEISRYKLWFCLEQYFKVKIDQVINQNLHVFSRPVIPLSLHPSQKTIATFFHFPPPTSLLVRLLEGVAAEVGQQHARHLAPGRLGVHGELDGHQVPLPGAPDCGKPLPCRRGRRTPAPSL